MTDYGGEEGSRMTPRFWLGSLGTSHHRRTCRQNRKLQGASLLVMSEFTQEGRWLNTGSYLDKTYKSGEDRHGGRGRRQEKQ